MAITGRVVDMAFGGGGLQVSTSGVTSTERLVCFVDTDTGGAGGAVTDWSLRVNVVAGGGADVGLLYTKDALGAGSSTYTFTIGGGADGAAILLAFDGSPNVDDFGGNTNSLIAPSVDIDLANGLIVCYYKIWTHISEVGTAAITLPSGGGIDPLFENVDSNGWGKRSALEQPVGSGSTGSRTATENGTHGRVGISLGLSAASTGQEESGGSETSIEVSVEGEGTPNLLNGSETLVEVSTEGSGFSSFSEGSETTIEVSTTTEFQLSVSGGSETAIEISAEGAGQTQPNFIGGSQTTVEVSTQSEAVIGVSGGSETIVEVYALTVFPTRRDITVAVGQTRGGGVVIGGTVTGSVIVGLTRRDRGE